MNRRLRGSETPPEPSRDAKWKALSGSTFRSSSALLPTTLERAGRVLQPATCCSGMLWSSAKWIDMDASLLRGVRRPFSARVDRVMPVIPWPTHGHVAGRLALTHGHHPRAGVRGPDQRARTCSMDCWRGYAEARARSWSSAARRASARPRCCATPPGRRPDSESRSSPAWRRRWSCHSRGSISSAGRCSDRLDALPAPQRDALSVALGLTAGEVPDRFLVGLAVLSLLAAVAEERPLLCLVEDAQWLDAASSQILGLVARRVRAESRGHRRRGARACRRARLPGLSELRLEGLPEQDARALLRGAVTGPLDSRVRRPAGS